MTVPGSQEKRRRPERRRDDRRAVERRDLDDRRDTVDRWPHIGSDQLRALWEQHAPDFVQIDDVDFALPSMRVAFLTWLERKGIDVGGRSEPSVGHRLRLDKVTFRRVGENAEAIVILELMEKVGEGRRSGMAAGDNMIRLPAEAAADAVRDLLPVVTFDIENAFAVGNGSDEQEIAVVIARDPESSTNRFIGACDINGSPTEAAVKATLQAINRHAEIAARLYDK